MSSNYDLFISFDELKDPFNDLHKESIKLFKFEIGSWKLGVEIGSWKLKFEIGSLKLKLEVEVASWKFEFEIWNLKFKI